MRLTYAYYLSNFVAQGVGKTAFVRKQWPKAYYVPMANGSNWFWQGYTYQDVVVFEEFKGPNYCGYESFKHLLSAAPFHVNIKNTSAEFNSSTIVITSNYHPFEWYSKVDRDPLFRRMQEQWCHVYFVAKDYARANGGKYALDRITERRVDELYLMTGQVLNDYLTLRPVNADAEDKVVDYTILRSFDVLASKRKYGHDVGDDEERKENDNASAADELKEVLDLMTTPPPVYRDWETS